MTENKPQILLMAEDRLRVLALEQNLLGQGWRVVTATDAIDALAAVRRGLADIALLHLPADDVTAIDLPNVLRSVREKSYLPVVIVVTGEADLQRRRLLETGADDVIRDNTSPTELAAKIRNLLRIKHLTDELSASRSALAETLAHERDLLTQLRRDNEYLHELATTDPLTHVQNVRSFHDVLRHEFRVTKRYNQSLSLLMLDIDHFKVVNDTHGHPSGDYVLKELAVILKQSVRESDIVARTGGEEFAVILPKANPSRAWAFAERIRKHVRRRKFIVFGENIHATISIGSATYPDNAEIIEPEMLVYFADQALLAAKESGRDRVLTVNDMDIKVRRRLRRQYRSMDRPAETRAPTGQATSGSRENLASGQPLQRAEGFLQ